jgi:hypothetical protein
VGEREMRNTFADDGWHCLCNQGFIGIKCFIVDEPEYVMDCNFCPECGRQLAENLPKKLSEWIEKRKNQQE